MPGHGSGKTGALLGLQRRDRRGPGRRAQPDRRRAGRVRRRARAGVPARRRPARHLGRPGGHRQARALRSAGAQEVAARHLGASTHGGVPGRELAAWLRERTDHASRRGPCWRAARRSSRPPAAATGPRPRPARRIDLGRAALDRVDLRCRTARRADGIAASSSTGRLDDARPPIAAPTDSPRPAPRLRTRRPRRRGRAPARDRSTPHGWWKGELDTNVTMDAEDLLLRAVPRHPHDPETREPAARGSARSSATTAPGPPSTAGPAICPPPSRPVWRCGWPATPADAPHMVAAAAFVRATAASRRTRVFTRIWLALFGLWSWDDLPEPAARDDLPAVVGPAEHLRLGVLGTADHRAADHRRHAAAGAAAAVRHRRTAHAVPRRARRFAVRRAAGSFQRLDKVLHRYARHPSRPLRRARDAPGRRVDPGPPGGRRRLGRHPAAVGVLAARAASARATAWTTR